MKGAQILVVEDESIIALEIRTRLEELGYQVVGTAYSGPRAIAMAQEYRPDLVLMDVILKGDLDGIETAEKIQQTARIPVIFLTAHTDEQTLQRAKITDPFGYLVKPFTARDLNIAIEMGLYKYRMEQRLRRSEETLRLLIESSDDIFIIQDLSGRYSYYHGSSRYGLKADEMVGKTPADFFDQAHAQGFMERFNQVIETGHSATEEMEIALTDEKLWFNVHFYPLRSATKQITGVATVLRNVTEIKRLKGLLPICAWCNKKIRNETGEWEPLDQYITLHTEAVITHSICDECMLGAKANY